VIPGSSRITVAVEAAAILSSVVGLWLISPAAFAQEEEFPRRSPVVDLVQRAGPAVVNIVTEEQVENPFHGSFLRSFFGTLFETPREPNGAEDTLGSGVSVDPRGYVITNEHVVLRASRITVTFPDRKKFPAEVVGTDPSSDLALLRLEGGAAFPILTLGRSSDLLVGETVIAVGNTPELASTATMGVLSAVKRSVRVGEREFRDFLQTDAAINSSNSGGPLFNIKGDLIGINTAIHSERERVSFAIPSDRARKVFEDLLRYGEVRLAWLGMDVRSVKEETAGEGVQLPAGAAVRKVYPGSPAQRAGLAAGDVIVRMGGGAITDHDDFDAVLSRMKTGESVAITWSRASSQRYAVLTAVEFPRSLSDVYLDDQVGVELADIPFALRQQTQTLPRDGVIVTRVRARSPAEATGLEEGDVIRQVNDVPIRDMITLRDAIPRVVGRPSLLLKIARGRFSYYATIDLS
jgi:serine protease Do